MLFLRRLACAAVCLAGLSVHAALFSFPSGTLNQTIPDGNPTGYANTLTLSGLDQSLVSISVGLQVSGGWNGDLYAYLTHGDALVVLLNRPGRTSSSSFGYSDSGFNITLGATGADIHDYQSVANYQTAIQNAGYSWSADGRNADPLSVTFDTPRTTSLSDYVGADPNGEWTLFFADMSGGAVSTLGSWSLNLEVVPEPVTMALAVFGGLLGAAQVIRRIRSRKASG